MSLKSFYFTLSFLLFYSLGFSQELYIPRDIQQAYQNKTRAKSGLPGEHYWQNQATYHIRLNINPPDRKIQGSEEITYTNNSPDTLEQLNFKLIMNHHKPGAPRAYAVPEDYLTTGVHIERFVENEQERHWDTQETDGTDKFVKLTQPLLPGKSVQFTIDWHYEISKQSGREGRISDNTFFLGYFYPRVAVYDDYAGWDVMPHTTAQEFYNDFSDYQVEVTVPEDYIVWATGELQNVEEVLTEQFAERFKTAKTADQVVAVVTQEDLDRGGITRTGENTWIWKAENITDFALAVSNEYKWDMSSLKIGNRRVLAQAAYDEPAKDFEQMVDFIKHSVGWFSNNFPGVDYPYPSMTVVRGFADMEFPMMANDSSIPDNPEFTRFVAEHEIAHTYFPFYMGTNETRFGFMDEGWATTMEYLIGIEDLGQKWAAENFKNFRVKSWINDSSFMHDLPIITPSNVLSRPSMSDNQYGKAALAYLALRDMLGEDRFKEVLHGYMDRWNGKHPMPWDFFYSFNDLSGQNLNWFWNAWFFSNHYIDIGIADITEDREGLRLQLTNQGGFPIPFTIVVESEEGTEQRFPQSPKVWEENLKSAEVRLPATISFKTIYLDNGIFVDADLSDNKWKLK